MNQLTFAYPDYLSLGKQMIVNLLAMHFDLSRLGE